MGDTIQMGFSVRGLVYETCVRAQSLASKGAQCHSLHKKMSIPILGLLCIKGRPGWRIGVVGPSLHWQFGQSGRRLLGEVRKRISWA